MSHSKTKTFIILCILVLVGCRKKCTTLYEFEIPYCITPSDTFNLEDTIWVTSNFSNYIKDRKTNEYFNVVNQDLNNELLIRSIGDTTVNIIGQVSAIDSFNIVNVIGSVQVVSSVTAKITLEYLEERYRFRAGFIPKREGVYNFAFNFLYLNAHDDVYDVEVTDSKCTEGIEKLYYKINEQSDGSFSTNYNILEENIDIDGYGGLDRYFFTFVVK